MQLINIIAVMFFILLWSIAAFNSDIDGNLPDEIEKNLSLLLVNRGSFENDSHMITNSIIQAVFPQVSYLITKQGFEKTNIKASSFDQVAAASPRHTQVVAEWNKTENGPVSEANILGGFTSFNIGTDTLEIAEAATTVENLAFYNARLVKIGDSIIFDTAAPLPVTTMSIGKNYAAEYLMNQERGGGFYLEVHDRPHFHMPLDEAAGGYLVLGKKLDRNTYQLSAFSIPFGYAIYTPGHVIHDDGLLIGNYLVVYSITENYSTAIVRNSQGEPVHVMVKKDKNVSLK